MVAIDGPAGAGKSTVARALAERLGYTLLDTGALYRSVALMAQREGVGWDDAASLEKLALGMEVVFLREGPRTRVLANGADVTEEIRKAEISEGASRVSALVEVRRGLLDIQRRVAARGSLVAEGCDIGTVVFPGAQAKFFLVANPETRAHRRALELEATGRPVTLEEVLAEMAIRDARDSSRVVAPLRRAEDAIELDSSNLSPTEIVNRMLSVVRERGG